MPSTWGGGSITWNDWAGRYVFLGGGDTEASHQASSGAMHIGFARNLSGPWNFSHVGDHNNTGCATRDSNSTYHPGCFVRAGVT